MISPWLVLGLLIVAYVGNSLLRGGNLRGRGLASGSEGLLLGLILGKTGFGIVHTTDLSAFSPVFGLGVAYLALIVGISFGVPVVRLNGEQRPVPLRGILAGMGTALLTMVVVVIATERVLRFTSDLALQPRFFLAGALGTVLCGSARQLVDWAVERFNAGGVLTDGLEGLSQGGDVIAILGMSYVAAIHSSTTLMFPDLALRSVVPVLLGGVMAIFVGTLRRSLTGFSESWGLLLGATFFVAGVCYQLGLSPVTGCFALGFFLGHGRYRRELEAQVRPTEAGVLLPTLVVAGASVQLELFEQLWVWVVFAVVVRIVVKLLVAPVFGALVAGCRGLSWNTGLVLSSSGEVAVLLALFLALLEPGRVGQTVLISVVLASVVGELLGRLGILPLLHRARELTARSTGSNRTTSTVSDRVEP